MVVTGGEEIKLFVVSSMMVALLVTMVNLVIMDLELLTMVLSSMMLVLMTLVNLVTMVVLQTTRAISDVEC